jgi:SAM-dependent methyltransferase
MPSTETLEQVQKAGRERLYPSITNPNWLVLRKRRELFIGWLKAIPSGGLSVLDVGGRIQPYRSLLGERCAGYMAIDISLTPLVDVVGQAERLPFADQRFDLIFCTQVLEYVPEPQLVVNEIYRTLKTGGWLVLSVPAAFPRDSETEFWRFLPCALQRLLSSFSSIEVAPEGNSLVGWIRTTNVCLVSLARPAVLGTLLRFSAIPFFNMLGFVLQWVAPSEDDRFSVNYSVLARK